MIVFAHRGDSGHYPENTLMAFEKALAIGVDGIELDVHKSKDNELVVIHDEDVKRTFNGKGLVKDFTLDELRKLTCRNSKFTNNQSCKIPTLREVFELIKDKDITLNIEAKTDQIHYDLEKDVLNLIQEYNICHKVLVSSFNHNCLNVFKEINNDINYGALYYSKSDYYPEKNVVEHAKKLNVYSIHLNEKLVNKDIVEFAHNNNLKVFVYTVNSSLTMKKMIDYNVDGVFSDFPELMNKIIKES